MEVDEEEGVEEAKVEEEDKESIVSHMHTPSYLDRG